jgi:ribose transport system substrate-binding protein
VPVDPQQGGINGMKTSTTRPRVWFLLLVVLLALALVASACGDDDDDAASTTAAPTTTAAATTTAADGGGEMEACAPEDMWLLYSGRTLSNPYYGLVDQGAKCFAESVGLSGQYQFVASESDSAQQLSQVTSFLAAHAPCVAVSFDPHETSITPAILDAVQEAGAYATTQWSRPDDIQPGLGDYTNWAAHITFNGVNNGYDIAKIMFDEMGGVGNIVALQGVLDNQAAITRFQGLEKALEEYPDIVLLEDQTAGWSATEAQAITETWLAEYGDDIQGIWAGNDNMALGAIEALRAVGKAGTVPTVGVDAIPDALTAIEAGEMLATVNPDPPYQGSVGLAIPYYAATGQLDLTAVDTDTRSAFHNAPLISADNVAEFLGDVDCAKYEPAWQLDDIWSRVIGPDTYE